MKFRFGSLEFDVELSPDSNDVYDIKLRQIVSSPSYTGPERRVTTLAAKPAAPHPIDLRSEGLQCLIKAGLSERTLTMIANKVLGLKTKSHTLKAQFDEMEKAALGFLSRPVGKDVWALYLAPVAIPNQKSQVAAVGLTEKNQFVILALEHSLKELFEQLVHRGLRPAAIKLGVVSIHLDDRKLFEKQFPKAAVGLDWLEFIDHSLGAQLKERLKEAMFMQNKKNVVKAVHDAKGPKELLTYFEFPQELHRALKTLAPIRRIEKEIKNNLRTSGASTEGQRQLVTAFSLIRLQYHWFKIPVNAPQLSNLKYIKEQEDSVSAD